MDVIIKRVLRAGLIGACAALPINSSLAVLRHYPADLPTVAPPYTMANADTLSVDSGTMATSSTNQLDTFTVQLQQNNAITIQSGAKLSYFGADSVGNSIYMNRSDNVGSTETIINQGTLSNGLGAFAIYVANSGAGGLTANIVNINNTSTVIGSIFTGGPDQVFLNLDSLATVSGSITLKARTLSTLNIGSVTPITFTNVGTINDIGLIHIFNGSTFNLINAAATIRAVTIDAGGTANLNGTVAGVTAPDGAITNNGSLNLYADITKTGSFTTAAAATTSVYKNITVSTTGVNGYNNLGTHNAVMNDVVNFGTLNLPIAIPNFNIFKVSYSNGYLAGGDYVLVNATSGIGVIPTTVSTPSNTRYIIFGTPTVVGNKIIISLRRNGYANLASTPITRRVGAILEGIGTSSPGANILKLLNAVESSTVSGGLDQALRQLCPLASAPLHGLEIQNESMEQAELRLAALHDVNSYTAGDFSRDNAFWVRPFGNLANQRPKDDLVGYYATTAGLAVGLDRALDEKFLLGAGASYSLSHVHDKINTTSDTLIKSYQVMLYGNYNFTNTKYLNWVVGVAANTFNGNRFINIGTINMTAKSIYSNQQYSAKIIWAKDYPFSDALQITPLASLQHTFSKQYTYTEREAPGANLIVNRYNSNIMQAGAGIKIGLPLNLDPAIFLPEIHAMALYNLINGKQDTIFNFVDGGAQTKLAMNMARSGVKFGCSLTFASVGNLDIKLNYDHEARDRYTNNSFFINFKYTL